MKRSNRSLTGMLCCTVLLALNTAAFAAVTERKPAPGHAELYFISPQDGASLTSPVRVVFGLRAMGVCPAALQHPYTGHHHLLVDVDEIPPADFPIPTEKGFIHFNDGETEAMVELSPGKHSLQLLLGDYRHVMHAPAVLSDKIIVHISAPGENKDDAQGP